MRHVFHGWTSRSSVHRMNRQKAEARKEARAAASTGKTKISEETPAAASTDKTEQMVSGEDFSIREISDDLFDRMIRRECSDE